MSAAGPAIRPANEADVPSLRRLLAQLGYQLDEQETARRLAAVMGAAEHAVLVAERAGSAVAFCHVYARPALDKPPEAVVQALVVDAAARGGGIGRAMMTAAEAWARARGFASVALASHVARDAAHAFYAGIGYDRIATSHLFRKELD
jgi:GNAT superfamily N-acetyltransferase